MSGTVNKVILIARLCRDPEVRYAQSGSKIVNMSVATNETWKDKNTGERKERAEYHRVVIFDERICDVVEKYLKKGSTVYLEGELRTRKWTGNDGVEKYTTEIVLDRFKGTLTMLGSRNGDPGAEPDECRYDSQQENGQPAATTGGDLDDEIPF